MQRHSCRAHCCKRIFCFFGDGQLRNRIYSLINVVAKRSGYQYPNAVNNFTFSPIRAGEGHLLRGKYLFKTGQNLFCQFLNMGI